MTTMPTALFLWILTGTFCAGVVCGLVWKPRKPEAGGWGKHYETLFQRASHERDWYKGLLFDAWKTMRGQTKGLQRQRRLIKRLQRELATPSKSSVTPQVE